MKEVLVAVGVLVAACLICGLAMDSCGGNGGGATSSHKPSDTDAVIMCQQFVKDRLKAPRTAKFQRASQARASRMGSDKWRIRSWVDAENSFGAMIRSNWTCEIEHRGQDRWRLLNLDID